MTNSEVWKPIKNYEDRYLISSTGRVMSLRRNMIMKPKVDKYGYAAIRLYDGIEKHDITIHRLVALTFIDNPKNLPCVNHKDENKLNNNVENLEWCSIAYNNNYGSHQKRSGDSRSKPIAQYSTSGKYIRTYFTADELRTSGFKRENCQMCARGKIDTAYGYIWKYVESED